jgi:hypothetical protein
VIKFNELANCAIYSTALDITDVANQLAAEGYPVDTHDLTTTTYIQHHPPHGRSRAQPLAAGRREVELGIGHVPAGGWR